MAALIEMKGIQKRFGAMHVIRGVNFSIDEAEVVGLVGDNAAGKSTLMKILAGLYTRDEGEVTIGGEQLPSGDPAEARRLGVEMVYQDFALAPHLTVAENVTLGREPTRFTENGFFLNRDKMLKTSLDVLADLDTDIPSPNRPVADLSGGQRQMVAIARALCFSPRLIIMDEPTANISVSKVATLLEVIKQLKQKGIATIIISHRLSDIFEVADRVVVLRHGEVRAERKISETNSREVADLMMGVTA